MSPMEVRYTMFRRAFTGRGAFIKSFHHAGCDLTEALKDAPHGPNMLDKFPIVGELLDSE